MPTQFDAVMTIKALADFLKNSDLMLYQRDRRGAVLGTKIHRHGRFKRQLIATWLETSGRKDLND